VLTRISRLLAVAQLACASWALAAGFQVNPVRVDLSSAHPNAVLTLSNPSPERILVQAEAFSWQQAEGEDQLQPTSAIMLNPPIFELQPGGRQLLRVGLRQLPKGDGEQPYRLWLSQLPTATGTSEPAAGDEPQGVKLLLRVSLPVFASGRTTGAARPVWQWQAGDRLQLVNFGQRHLHLLKLSVSDGHGASLDLPARYVLAGNDSVWQLPSGWHGRQLQIEADSDAGHLHASLEAADLLRP
jgi:fimbrial chaperone protein